MTDPGDTTLGQEPATGSVDGDAGALELSILIVSYNTRDMTLAAIDSVVRETRTTRYELIVVDNLSSDGSAAAISAHAARPNLIALDENVGFARGNNLAARGAKGEYLLLLNPDTIVLDGAIDRLMAFARRRPEAMIWGGRTLFADGRLNPGSCWGRITVWNLLCRATGLTGLFKSSALFNTEAYGGWRRDSERAVDIVSGCFLLIPRALWERLGGFDASFFMYGEEADLCLRARTLGARPAITPDASIIHYGGASEAARTSKMTKLLAAKATLVKKHLPRWQQPAALVLLAAWPLTRAIALLGVSVAGRKDAATSAATWLEIWRRRDQWIGGYPPVTAREAAPSAPPLTARAGRHT